MNIIISNYGDDSMALLQWAYEHQVLNVTVISIDTGWAAESWAARVEEGEAWVRRLGFTPVRLHSAKTFAALVSDRQQFPSRKYQWCVSLLKALPIMDYLEQHDPHCTATILLAKRRSASRLYRDIPEYIEESDMHGERRVWHPLYLLTIAERDALIERAGFPVLHHRSLECDPCIHNTPDDFARLADADQQKLEALETAVGKPCFALQGDADHNHIRQLCQHYAQALGKSTRTHYNESFDMGCGSHWACGQ